MHLEVCEVSSTDKMWANWTKGFQWILLCNPEDLKKAKKNERELDLQCLDFKLIKVLQQLSAMMQIMDDAATQSLSLNL